MKIFQSSIFRALCAIITGAMLLHTPDSTVEYITVAIGVLFLVSGVISCLGYYNSLRSYKETKYIDEKGQVHESSRPFIPIVGVGSIILGFILALMPRAFVKSLMYVLAALLILGAITQIIALLNSRKFSIMPAGYWVLPILVLLAGIFICVKPMAAASTPLIIIGVSLIVYGVSECINSFAIHRKRKQVFGNLPMEREGEYIDYTEETEEKE